MKKKLSRAWFRSTDLWVMGPARFHCATLLGNSRRVQKLYEVDGSTQSIIDHSTTVESVPQNLQQKCVLPGGESNPGLPRDRRGYLPLYYRGHVCGRQNIIANARYYVFGFAKNHNLKDNSTATPQRVPTAASGSKSEDAATNSHRNQ